MAKSRLESNEAKINSTLMKDINRIQKIAETQIRMNILRKHQIKLINDFLYKLLKERRITIEELKPYMPKKKKAEKELFSE